MRRLAFWVGLACGLALLLSCYRSALFSDQQFGFRDAAHFYYPLYQKVEAEWRAGRVPLWDPSENAGMPLLGNPTAAVLYPGKLIYTALPYAWAARLYAVAHTALAFAGMLVLCRGWGTSRAGATIAAIGYAFGGPVLFQYCNIIFLVGAAWLPWGFHYVDGWLRRGRVGSVAGLAFVLAMEVLGGDPETAYVTGLCAGLYAFGLAKGQGEQRRWMPGWAWVPIGVAGLALWVGITLILAAKLPGFRPEPRDLKSGATFAPIARWLTTGKLPTFQSKLYEGPVPGFAWIPWIPRVMAAAWGCFGLWLILRWRRGEARAASVVPKLAGLACAAGLAAGLAAAQLGPVLEFTAISARATDEGPHDIYPFSLEPYRALEMIWPGFFNGEFGAPVSWMGILPPRNNHKTWVPTLYLGGLTLLLALGALGRGGREAPWRGWLTAVAALSLIASFGEFASPLWAARYVPSLVPILGPHDSPATNSVRLDGYLRDGDGSPYCLMSAIFPGLHTFRYPSKLLVFTAVALAGLAGVGWDRVVAGKAARVRWLAGLGTVGSLAAMACAAFYRREIVSTFEAERIATIFGPFEPERAVRYLIESLAQGGIVLAAGLALAILARRRPALAGVLVVIVASADLGWADRSLVRTVPQAELDKVPEVIAIIREAEKQRPADGPFRLHRVPVWSPLGWRDRPSRDRILDFVQWERDTIQPKYGITHGVEYTQTVGTAELYDYQWFFSPFPRKVSPEMARSLNVNQAEPIVVFPRRGFDLWNTRYFIIPAVPNWTDPDRGYASFLPRAERIYPLADVIDGKANPAAARDWLETKDVQIFRNKDAFPRAWVVHDARFKPPVVGLTRGERKETMEEILFSNDPFWNDPERSYFDPRQIAWIETADTRELRDFLPKGPPLAGETVQFLEQSPQRVVIKANLLRPGLVILGDVFYPGWTLKIDDQPAPILRANRLMRGAAVKAGEHTLVYEYHPRSFQVGALVSLGSIVVWVGLIGWSALVKRKSVGD